MQRRTKLALIAGTVACCLVLASHCASAAPRVPNPSFEVAEQGDAGPQGWKFVGTDPAQGAAWTSEVPFHEKHALRLDARQGSQSWESERFELKRGGKYLLQWQARFRGEKSWRFRADFSGVEVCFYDAQGNELERARQHSNCWQTTGWRPAWLSLTAPEATKAASIRYAIETKSPLLGGFDVDSVSLESNPPDPADHPGMHLVTLRLSDEKAQPTTARIRVVDEKGTPIVPAGAISYAQSGAAFHALDEGSCWVLASPGRYSVSVTKGLEYRPWSGSLDVKDSDVELNVALDRPHDWHKRGWFCGDHHVHLFRHGGSLFPSIDWRDVMRAARCEGLDFLPFMGEQRLTQEWSAELARLRDEGLAAELTDEITEDFWGHVCPVGVSAESRKDPRYSAGPMNFDRDATFAGRGILCYAHPYGPMDERRELYAIADPKFGLVAREFPIDLALGMTCGIDLLAMEGNQNQLELKLRDLYRLYNLGFRPTITASTDFHVDQGRQPIGAVRTYVRSAVLGLSQIANAYRKGHTFATNGPLIDFRVGDAVPGDEIRLANANKSVKVDVETVSIGRLERVEIVVNGQEFKSFTSTDPHRVAGTIEIPAKYSLWIAARAIGVEDANLASSLEGRPLGGGQFAHTTPTYVVVEDRPMHVAQPADAEYFVKWCDAATEAWKSHVATVAADTQHDSLVSERIAKARRVFQDLASSLERKSKD